MKRYAIGWTALTISSVVYIVGQGSPKSGLKSRSVSLINDEPLKQCKYVVVDQTPYMCAKNELILVSSEVADDYCLEKGFVQFQGDKTYCQYNGAQSLVKSDSN